MKQKLGAWILERRRECVLLLLSFLGTYGCLYLGGIAGVQKASFSAVGLLLFLGLYGLLARTGRKLSEEAAERSVKRRLLFGAVVSYLFSLTMVMGYQLQINGMTDPGVKGKGLILLRALCFSIAVFPFGNMLFAGIEKLGAWNPSQEKGKQWRLFTMFGISAMVIFLCLIPVWAAYYPIVMSYDFHRQVNDAAKGFIWFAPYQPLAHTWIIWVFFQLGQAMGNLEAGMAGMALVQMLVYALTAAYVCVFLYRITKKKWAVVAAVLFFGVFPLNSVMVVCTTKDVLFSILFLLFQLLLAERSFFSSGRRKLIMDVLLVLEGCIMIQFRNNCIYAVAVYGIIWFLFGAKKEKLRILLLCVLLLAGGQGLSIGIKAALGTKINIQKIEMYSVPIQQFARVGYYHGSDMDLETWKLIEPYIPADMWPDYNPPISDTVKGGLGLVFAENWEGHIGEMFKAWAAVGLRYPNEYIDAFLELTRGYWFLDDRSYAECLGWGVEGRMGILYTYNSSIMGDGREILHQSKFPWLEKQLEKIVSGNAFYNWPVISLLFKSAFYFWSMCLVFLAYLFLRQKKQALFGGYLLVYMATMLLGPVVQLRYIFPVMVTLPLLIGLLFVRNSSAMQK